MVAWRAWLRQWGPLFAVLALAALLRLWDLGSGPDPLDVDEGYGGVDVLRVLQGHWTIYFAANNGAEPLYVYLAALTTALLGPSALALRLPAALAGVASVLATYLLVRAVFRDEIVTAMPGPAAAAASRPPPDRANPGATVLHPGTVQNALLDDPVPRTFGLHDARALALLAALLQAVSLWHLQLSRDGSRVVLLPLLVTLAVWTLWEGLRGRSQAWRWFLAAGLCFGLALYTYLPARLLPLLVLALVVHLAFSRRAWLRARWWGIPLAGAVAALVAAPLAAYYASHWSAFLFRVDMVSIANPWVNEGDPGGLLWRNLQGTAGMFAVQGDTDPQYNVKALPVFPPTLAALFALGLAVAVWRVRRPAYALFLAWLGIMLLPGVLSANAPHFARQAGIIPAVYVFPALAIWQLWRWARARAERPAPRGSPGPALQGGGAEHHVRNSAATHLQGSGAEDHAPKLADNRPRLDGASQLPRFVPLLVALGLILVVGSAGLGAVLDYWGRPVAKGPTLLASLATLPPADEVYVAGSEETTVIGSYLSGLGPRPRFTQGFHSLLLPRDPARTIYLVEQDWWWLTAEQLLWARYDLLPQPAPPGLERFRVLRLADRPAAPGLAPDAVSSDSQDPSLAAAPWSPLPPARWPLGVRLVGYGLPPETRPGEVVGVTLRWRVEAPAPDDPGQDYTFSVGLLDATGAWVAGRDWLGHHAPMWRDGDEVVSWFDLCLPPTLAPGPLQALVALYSRADFARRPLRDPDGAHLGDQLPFGSLPVAGPPQDPPCGARVHPALPP